MEDRKQMMYAEHEEINVSEYLAVLRHHWWKIICLSLAAGMITLLSLFLKPNLYNATAIVIPEENEGKRGSAFGALAVFGIPIGGPTKVEDLEALFKSNDLTVRIFRKYDLWEIVLPDDFDEENGKLTAGWMDRLTSGKKERYRDPTDWDAIRVAEKRLNISVNRKMGTLSISFESPSPEGSAKIVKLFLEEGRSRLQEEAFERAVRNKTFIEEQISKTVDALTRDRLYSLYGQEVEKEMLARNREQFGFRIIDSPRIPDRKSSPQRGLISIIVSILSFPIWAMIIVFLRRKGP